MAAVARLLSRRPYEPLYVQIKQILVDELEAGAFDGQGFPSESELVERFRVSRTTVRLALDEMSDEGYITRQRGRRTLVVRLKLRSVGHFLITFFDEMKAAGCRPRMRTLTFGIQTARPRVAEALDAPSSQEFYVTDRLGSADGKPVLVSTVYIPKRPGISLTRADIQRHGSIITLFEHHLGIPIIGASRALEAVSARPEEAALLKVDPGAPLLLKWTLAYASSGEPAFLVNARFRADRYQYYIPFLSRQADRGVAKVAAHGGWSKRDGTAGKPAVEGRGGPNEPDSSQSAGPAGDRANAEARAH